MSFKPSTIAPPTRVVKAADAAWENYRGTVAKRLGEPERRTAFDAALRAERKLWAAQRTAEAERERADNRAKARAGSGA